jgi:hypothetical protein
MMYKYKLLLLVLTIVTSVSCRHDRLKVNVSSIKEEVAIVRFENDFFSLGSHPDSLQIAGLCSKFPAFSDLFFNQTIHIGTTSDSTGRRMISEFLTDSVIQLSKKRVEQFFPKNADFQKNLVKAFKHYRYYFPDNTLPVVYTCLSGFNESVFTSNGIIGVSLDKYMGATCEFYPLLGFTKYKQRKMIPEMIPSDVIHVWGMEQFPISRDATTIVDYMVHEGKLLCFCEALLPEMADTLLTGFSARQLKWCEKNEPQMWNYLIENKLLFSTKQMDIVRYINDGPTTNGFPPESPGRTGVWLGWQIVRAYLKHHPEVTLSQLMSDNNYMQILNSSAYAPE